jgi:hypothetical protein
MRTILSLTSAAAVASAGGCKKKIGDSCTNSTECDRLGGRLCDLSHSRYVGSGECTIEGCGRGSCPDEAACVKIYGSEFLSVSCDPEREDRAVVGPNGESLPPLDHCLPNEVCLPEGLCADEVTARTSCRRECDEESDCRSGYTCRSTGSQGVYRSPDLENPDDDSQVKICMPES